MVANNDGNLRVMRKSSFEQNYYGTCFHTPQQHYFKPITGIEEWVQHAQQCQPDEDVA
jgi:hypothetical protein